MTTRNFSPVASLPERMLIEASAGTGKTYALCGLTAHQVASGQVTIDQILVVTFTNLATEDLKDRIRERLTSVRDDLVAVVAGERDGGDLRDEVSRHLLGNDPAGHDADVRLAITRIDDAITDLGDLAISTIHGFAQRTLRTFGAMVGIEPELPVVRQNDQGLRSAIADELAERAHDLATTAPDLDRGADWIPEVGSVLQILRDLENVPGIEIRPTDLVEIDFLELVRRQQAEVERLTAAVRDLRIRLRNRDYPNRKKKNTEDELGELRDELGKLSRIRAAWIALRARDRAQVARRTSGIRSYDDLLTELHSALDDPERARPLVDGLRHRYKLVMIDEFQDTDGTQWDIFDACFGVGDSKLVLVGDPKQAIYRFRGADIHTYHRAREAVGESGLRDLRTNHRSDQAILHAVETVLGGVEFGPDADFVEVDHAPGHDGSRIRWRDGVEADEPLRPLRLGVLRERGGFDPIVHEDLGGWITRLLADAELLDTRGGRETWRPVAPDDIAVLTNSNHVAMVTQQNLRAAGIPAAVFADDDVRLDPTRSAWNSATGGSSPGPSEAAQNWRLLLEALADPGARGRVRAAALTVFGPTIADDDISAGRDDLATLVTDDPRVGNLVLDRFQQQIANWAKVLTTAGLPALLTELRAETPWLRRAAMRDDDDRLFTDLAHIGDFLCSIVGSRGAAVDDLLHALVTTDEDTESEDDRVSRRVASDRTAVSIMTIHKAKGLEFPIVGCLGLHVSRKGKKSELVRYHDAETRSEVLHTAADDVANELAAQESGDDDLRKLYVALTRGESHVFTYWGQKERDHAGKLPGPLDRVLFSREASGDLVVGEELTGRRPVVTRPQKKTDGPFGDYGEIERALTAASEVEGVGSTISWVTLDDSAIAGDASADASDDAEAEGQADMPALEKDDEDASADASGAPLQSSPLPAVARRTNRWSFTGITNAMRADEAERTVATPGGGDEPDVAVGPDPADPVMEPTPFQTMLAGADFGVFVHEVLEHTVFDTDRDELLTLVEKRLARDTSPLRRRGLDEGAVQILVDGLLTGLRAPIGPLGPGGTAVRLADIGGRDRLDECEFDLHLDTVDRGETGLQVGARIRERLLTHLDGDDPYRPWADELGGRHFDLDIAGHLTGSIDLVYRIEHEDGPRFHVADYKTNRLDAYDPTALVGAMSAADYPLQALLYTVGLHRYLRWRMPDYDPNRHLGDVTYLFLRGMTGEGTDPANPPGIARWAIPVPLVEALDDLFAGREVTTP